MAFHHIAILLCFISQIGWTRAINPLENFEREFTTASPVLISTILVALVFLFCTGYCCCQNRTRPCRRATDDDIEADRAGIGTSTKTLARLETVVRLSGGTEHVQPPDNADKEPPPGPFESSLANGNEGEVKVDDGNQSTSSKRGDAQDEDAKSTSSTLSELSAFGPYTMPLVVFERGRETFAVFDGDGIYSKYPYIVNITEEIKNLPSDTSLSSLDDTHATIAKTSGSNGSLFNAIPSQSVKSVDETGASGQENNQGAAVEADIGVYGAEEV